MTTGTHLDGCYLSQGCRDKEVWPKDKVPILRRGLYRQARSYAMLRSPIMHCTVRLACRIQGYLRIILLATRAIGVKDDFMLFAGRVWDD